MDAGTTTRDSIGPLSRRRLLTIGAITGTGLVAGAVAACTTPVSGGWGLEPSSVAPPAAGSSAAAAIPSPSAAPPPAG